jgi:hypothetical protein
LGIGGSLKNCRARPLCGNGRAGDGCAAGVSTIPEMEAAGTEGDSARARSGSRMVLVIDSPFSA